MKELFEGAISIKMIEYVHSLWEVDTKVDHMRPGDALLDIPKLHYKYLHILSHFRVKAKSLEMEKNNLRTIKYDFYMGRLGEDELKKRGWEPFPFVLKSDVTMYMDGDEDLHRVQFKKSICDEIVDICTAIIKELTARTYQLRDYIAWQKFTQGV